MWLQKLRQWLKQEKEIAEQQKEEKRILLELERRSIEETPWFFPPL